MPVALASHAVAAGPWRRLTDAKWAEPRWWLPHGDPDVPRSGAGRPSTDLRRTLSRWAGAGVLGLVDAWPANPLTLPSRNLSKTAKASLRTVGNALRLNTMLLARGKDDAARVARQKTHRTISRALRTGWRQLRLGVCGNRRQWRLK